LLLIVLLYRQFRLCITKASGEAHTPKVARIPRAPSGRELSAKLTEGECVTMRLLQTQSYAGSFRHAPRATFLPEEGFFATPIITQIGRENKLSADIFVPANSPLRMQRERSVFFVGLGYNAS